MYTGMSLIFRKTGKAGFSRKYTPASPIPLKAFADKIQNLI
jgi:hypothetical protein